jgi:hypothetical protein
MRCVSLSDLSERSETLLLPARELLSEIDRERISQMKTDELDRLVAAGKIRAIDREYVRFTVRRIVHPPERVDDPLRENAVGSG